MKEPKTTNRRVAAEPIVDLAAKSLIKGGMAYIENKVSLLELKLVFGSDDGPYEAGDSIVIHGDNGTRSAWARDVLTMGDKKFILVPFEAILMVRHREKT